MYKVMLLLFTEYLITRQAKQTVTLWQFSFL